MCLEDGKLKIKYAACKTARACLERMHIIGIKASKGNEKNKSTGKMEIQSNCIKTSTTYVYRTLRKKELPIVTEWRPQKLIYGKLPLWQQ